MDDEPVPSNYLGKSKVSAHGSIHLPNHVCRVAGIAEGDTIYYFTEESFQLLPFMMQETMNIVIVGTLAKNRK